MAKLKCKLVSIYAPRNDEKAILRRLQEMSVMDIESAAEDEETSALPEGFTKTDTEDRVAAYERNAETAAAAIKILNTRAPRKKGLAGMFGGARYLGPERFYLKRGQIESALSLALKWCFTMRVEPRACRSSLKVVALFLFPGIRAGALLCAPDMVKEDMNYGSHFEWSAIRI